MAALEAAIQRARVRERNRFVRRASRANGMAGSSPAMTIEMNSASPRLRVKYF